MRDRELDALASFVHGAVTLGNLLGALYNIRRRNWTWVGIHLVGVALHSRATWDHARECR